MRNEVKRVFVDGDEVCVIYDFVTDTTAGALPTIEWLNFDGSRIRAIDLYYDRQPWQTVMATIAERAGAAPAGSARAGRWLEPMSTGDKSSLPELGEAFAELRPALLRHCYRMLGSFEEAEDTVQDVLVRAWRSRDTFAGDAPLAHWLMRIATNACLNVLTRERPRALPQLDRDPSRPARRCRSWRRRAG